MLQQKLRNIAIVGICILFFALGSNATYGWGFFAHRIINRQAVFSLPPDLLNFYKYHIYVITENSVNPDRRRGVVKNEAIKHFIDLDHYTGETALSMPFKWQEAVSRFSQEKLLEHGIAPWNIVNMKYRLIAAFKGGDVKQIIKISSDIGHYIADINVPLHTCQNYNGQLTNQHGIHRLWESRLPELFVSTYNLFIGKASYIKDLNKRIWSNIGIAHSCVVEVLNYERELSDCFSPHLKYSFEQRGNTLQKVYSIEYSTAYHNMLNGMVERQMRASIRMVADVWYTCWVDAGKPSITSLVGLCEKLSNDLDTDKEIFDTTSKIECFRDCS